MSLLVSAQNKQARAGIESCTGDAQVLQMMQIGCRGDQDFQIGKNWTLSSHTVRYCHWISCRWSFVVHGLCSVSCSCWTSRNVDVSQETVYVFYTRSLFNNVCKQQSGGVDLSTQTLEEYWRFEVVSFWHCTLAFSANTEGVLRIWRRLLSTLHVGIQPLENLCSCCNLQLLWLATCFLVHKVIWVFLFMLPHDTLVVTNIWV